MRNSGTVLEHYCMLATYSTDAARVRYLTASYNLCKMFLTLNHSIQSKSLYTTSLLTTSSRTHVQFLLICVCYFTGVVTLFFYTAAVTLTDEKSSIGKYLMNNSLLVSRRSVDAGVKENLYWLDGWDSSLYSGIMDLAFGLSIWCEKYCLTQLVHSQTHANKSWCVHACSNDLIITQSFMHLVAPLSLYIVQVVEEALFRELSFSNHELWMTS
jgi:hypothetical protein